MLRRNGGSGTTNPRTGLPEFFLGKIFKSVGNVFKSVGKAVVSGVKSVARGVKKFASSTVGRIVIGAALAFFLGPMAATYLAGATGIAAIGSTVGVATVGGFIGGFGSTLLAGKGIKEALKIGAIGGVTAGFTAGVVGGADAFAAGSYTGPTTISGQFDRLVSGAKDFVGAGATPGAEVPLGAGAPSGAEALPVYDPGANISVTPGGNLGASQVSGGFDYGGDGLSYSDTPGFTRQFNVAPVGRGASMSDPRALGGAGDLTPSPTTTMPTAAPDAVDLYGIRTTPTPKNAFSLSTASPTPPPGGTEKGFFGNLFEKISPSTPTQEVLNQKGFEAVAAAQKLYPAATEAQLNTVFKNAVAQATPSVLRQYAPLALGAVGIMGLAGGFKQPESEQPNLTGGVTGQQLLDQRPEKDRLQFGGVNTTYATPPAYYNPRNYQSQAGDPYAIQPIEPVRRFAEGGSSNVDGYPRKQGAINGPGTGTSDSIKALLSDGEFVFTAKAVRGAGQGSRRKGAKRMYQLMRSLEGKA
jgi:hypothetical protein